MKVRPAPLTLMCVVAVALTGTAPAVDAADVAHLPGVPTYPGSRVGTEIYEDAIFYETDAGDEQVYEFYQTELSARGWECYRTRNVSYFVKGDRAFELFMTDGDINYHLLDPARARAEGADLSEEEYIDTVVAFAARLKPYYVSLEETQERFDEAKGEARMAAMDSLQAAYETIDAAIAEIGPAVGATADRLSDLTEEYGLVLMNYLREHSDLKNKGVPEILVQMEYWDVTGSLVENRAEEHPEEAEALMESYVSFAGEWGTW